MPALRYTKENKEEEEEEEEDTMLVCTVGDVRVWRGQSIRVLVYHSIFTLDLNSR